MKYLIFLDIDGTILPENHIISPRTIRAIKDAQEQGHLVFINSGRSIAFMPEELSPCIQPTGVVAGLGTCIRMGKEILLSVNVPKEMVLLALDVADRFDNRVVLEGENYCVSYHGEFFHDIEHDLSTPGEIYERYPDIRVSKMTYKKPLSEEAIEILSPYFDVCNHADFGEIGLPGYSKATGMEFLRQRFGIDKEHVIAMGDSENDRLMLEKAGIAVVMGNGTPKMKEIADFISIDCADGGVGYAIEELVLKRR